MSIKLGTTVRDVITGFEGVVTGRAEYLTGCAQVQVVPRVLDKDGKRRDSEWFDEQRVSPLPGVDLLTLDNTKTPGLDERPPAVRG